MGRLFFSRLPYPLSQSLIQPETEMGKTFERGTNEEF